MAKRVPVIFEGRTLDRTKADDRARIAELKTACIRFRNFGAPISTIADKLAISEDAAELLLTEGLREVMADDATAVAARQQATLNDIKRAMYDPMMAGDDKSANVLMKVLDHEAKLHGLHAPTRVRIGLDQDAFTTTVDEDIRALGIHPQMDAPLDQDDNEGWANT